MAFLNPLIFMGREHAEKHVEDRLKAAEAAKPYLGKSFKNTLLEYLNIMDEEGDNPQTPELFLDHKKDNLPSGPANIDLPDSGNVPGAINVLGSGDDGAEDHMILQMLETHKSRLEFLKTSNLSDSQIRAELTEIARFVLPLIGISEEGLEQALNKLNEKNTPNMLASVEESLDYAIKIEKSPLTAEEYLLTYQTAVLEFHNIMMLIRGQSKVDKKVHKRRKTKKKEDEREDLKAQAKQAARARAEYKRFLSSLRKSAKKAKSKKGA